MITLFFAPMTRALRIRWLLEEMGTAYELVNTEFDRSAGQAKQNTPTGQFPVI
jgi:glutathione S-transferase